MYPQGNGDYTDNAHEHLSHSKDQPTACVIVKALFDCLFMGLLIFFLDTIFQYSHPCMVVFKVISYFLEEHT